MNSLLCVIGYCRKDAAAALELLKWIDELGGCQLHHCLLVVDSKVDGPQRVFIKMSAENSFASVEEIEFQEPAPPKVLRWPLWRYFANQMWLRAAWHVSENCRLPWLWLEADATPMRAGWLDTITNSYYAQPKLFHGPIILAGANRPAHWPAAHMAGVAVYPPRAGYILKDFCGGEHTWDLGAGDTVVPKATKCRLIQHSYGPSEEDGWKFKVKAAQIVTDHPDQTVVIRDDCVLFHRCDDDSLIRCLRQLRSTENGNGHYQEKPEMIGTAEDFMAMQRAVTPEPIKRGPGRSRKVTA